MKILLVSYYFPPDLCAGAFRAHALADALIRQGNGQVELHVLTTEPNRYRSHQPDASESASDDYRIFRLPLPENRWGFIGQIRSFAAFGGAAAKKAPEAKYDVVIATSSRLMTGALGAWLARRKGAACYLDIRDIFIDTIQYVYPGVVVSPLKVLLSRIERYAVSRAARVNLVSPGFLPYFRAISPDKPYRVFTNGIDEDFDKAVVPPKGPPVGKVRIIYAGNIGHGQGLERILPELAIRLSDRASFTVIGDGSTRSALKQRCDALGSPVSFVDPVAREQLLDYYNQADVLFLHLNDLPAFLKVLPSKLFEYLATGKPVLAGVDGYCREFLVEHAEGVATFQPCDVEGAIKAFGELKLAHYPRERFVNKFSRRRIMDEMAADILDLGQVAQEA